MRNLENWSLTSYRCIIAILHSIGDSLLYHDGHPFSTKDNYGEAGSCSRESANAAWWYNDCQQSNLNGRNLNARQVRAGITWNTWRGSGESLAAVELALKPIGRGSVGEDFLFSEGESRGECVINRDGQNMQKTNPNMHLKMQGK